MYTLIFIENDEMLNPFAEYSTDPRTGCIFYRWLYETHTINAYTYSV